MSILGDDIQIRNNSDPDGSISVQTRVLPECLLEEFVSGPPTQRRPNSAVPLANRPLCLDTVLTFDTN